MPGAKRMYTSTGDEVRSFSQLRNEFADVETFYLDSTTSAIAPIPIGSPIRRSRSRNNIVTSTAATAAAATAIGNKTFNILSLSEYFPKASSLNHPPSPFFREINR